MTQTTLQFHHSTAQTNIERLNETVRATSQTAAIWALMSDGNKRTSVMVSDTLKLNLNSTRRALTDLMKKFNLVIKLDEGKEERFGGFNHYYIKSTVAILRDKL